MVLRKKNKTKTRKTKTRKTRSKKIRGGYTDVPSSGLLSYPYNSATGSGGDPLIVANITASRSLEQSGGRKKRTYKLNKQMKGGGGMFDWFSSSSMPNSNMWNAGNMAGMTRLNNQLSGISDMNFSTTNQPVQHYNINHHGKIYA